jgi:CheY-like chemotaxis protein
MKDRSVQNLPGAVPRVMVVDDTACIRETVSDLLPSHGIQVVTADGGESCLRLLRAGFRGVILMDVMMPDMNGWATIRAIAKEGLLAGNIIAMLTAQDVPDEQMEGLQEFIVDYITKPFDPAELIRAIRRYFRYLDQPPTVEG